MKKIISIILILTMMLNTLLPAFADNQEIIVGDENENIQLENGIVLTKEEFIQYLYNHSNEIIQISSEYKLDYEFESNINYSTYQLPKIARSATGGVLELVEGTWYIPGIGEIVVIGAAIYVGGVLLTEAGSWLYNEVIKFLERKAQEKLDNIYNSIPPKLRGSDGHVKLDKFTEKVSGKTSYKDPKSGWVVDKDTAGHGGRKWKLKNKFGKRVASLDENGKILGK